MELRRTFNVAAPDYETFRPSYPQSLAQDVIDLSGIPAAGTILEIGCGTGQATRLFAARGYRMVCLDIGPDMVEIAKARFRDQPNVTFVVTEFEEFDPAGHTFDLIIAGTSFRWIRPEAQYVKTSAFLKPGGALAVLANQQVGRDRGFFAEVQEIYRLYAPSLATPAAVRDARDGPIPGSDLYDAPMVRRVPWSQEYTAEQYVRLLGTYSDHIALPEDQRRRLLREIARLIETRYGGKVVKHHEAVLDLRKKHRA